MSPRKVDGTTAIAQIGRSEGNHEQKTNKLMTIFHFYSTLLLPT